MNEQSDFERLVADQLSNAGVGTPPRSAVEDTIAQAEGSRRLPEWLALIKESPMRTNNHLAVGSPTVRVVVVMAATLLLALSMAAAGAGVQRLLAADSPIIVDQDGAGDFTAISDAVAAAEDGDEILVRPGTYTETVDIAKDIAVRGDGPVEEVVVVAPEDGPLFDTRWLLEETPYAIALLGTEGELAGITVSGVDSRVVVDGGAPLLSGLVLDGVGGTPFVAAAGLIINGEGAPTIQGNTFLGGGGIYVFEASAPVIEGNTIASENGVFGIYGDGTVIRRNRFETPGDYAIEFEGGAEVLIEDNDIADKYDGIRHAEGPFRIVGNTIDGSTASAISVLGDGGEISGNTLTGNGTAIQWLIGSGAVTGNTLVDNVAGMSLAGQFEVTANDISGGDTGLTTGAGDVMLEANTIEDVTGRGIAIGGTTQATLTGNRSCDNGVNLYVDPRAAADVDDSNDICPDSAA